MIFYRALYVQGDETANRVPNGNFAQGLNGWGFWGTRAAYLEPANLDQIFAYLLEQDDGKTSSKIE